MSKLQKQIELPRRNFYIARTEADAKVMRGMVHPDDVVEVVRKLPKPARKAKKAKGKR